LRDAAGCVLCAVAIMMAFFARVLVLGDTADGGSRVQKRTVLEFTETRKISNKLNGAAEQMHSKCKANAEQMHTQSQSQLQHDDDDARREVSHGTLLRSVPWDTSDRDAYPFNRKSTSQRHGIQACERDRKTLPR
jgi:hypothetical protein